MVKGHLSYVFVGGGFGHFRGSLDLFGFLSRRLSLWKVTLPMWFHGLLAMNSDHGSFYSSLMKSNSHLFRWSIAMWFGQSIVWQMLWLNKGWIGFWSFYCSYFVIVSWGGYNALYLSIPGDACFRFFIFV